MASEYDTVPLGEVASVRSGFAFKSSDWTETGIPVVKIANVKDGRLVMDGCSFVPQPVADSAAEFALQAGDILIAMTGYIGDVAIVRDRDLPAALNQRVGRFEIRDPRRLDQRFLFYVLRDADVRKEIEGLGYGSAQPNVSPSLIHGVEVPLPLLPEQRAIARILGTLDDKIELNRRMSETLEAMARGLFKSWFIDFDPVRRNAARARNQRSPPAPLPEGGRHYRGGYDFAGLVETARVLRRKQTPAEGIFWEMVRSRRFMGLKFRRQHQLGDYIADFYCHEHRLVVELDGGIHSAKRQKDHKRDVWMEAQGFTVLRIRNGQILDDPRSVLSPIAEIIHPAAEHPLPLGEGQGEGVVGGEAYDHLFPDSFEDSELGEIPRGWDVGRLGDVAEHSRRGVRADQIALGMPYIALEHMPKRCIALSKWDSGEGLESNKFEFKRGEILFGKLRPYFHKVGVAPVDGVCSTDIVVVAPQDRPWFGFVLGHVSSVEFVEYTNAGSTGTKMPRTSWSEMARYELVLPPKPVAEAFTAQVQPSVDRMIAAIHESRDLAALRDALLPKLISGELRVGDGERIIGAGEPERSTV